MHGQNHIKFDVRLFSYIVVWNSDDVTEHCDRNRGNIL